jgi:hypothetical protein
MVRGQLQEAGAREVRAKDTTAFTVYEASLVAGRHMYDVSFYDQAEMTAVLRNSKPGDVIVLPVYTRVRNGRVYLHYARATAQATEAQSTKPSA